MHQSVWLCPLAGILKKAKSNTYNILENIQIKPLAQTDQIKDLGILLDERLSFRDHINDKINKAFSMLGIIKRQVILNILQFSHLLCYIKTW